MLGKIGKKIKKKIRTLRYDKKKLMKGEKKDCLLEREK